MGSNCLEGEAASGTCLNTLQLEAVGFGIELLIYLSPNTLPQPRLLGKKSLSLHFPLRPHLTGVSHFSVAGRSASRPRWPRVPGPLRSRRCAGGVPLGARSHSRRDPRGRVPAAVGEGGEREAAGDRCTPLTALSISPVAPCHWLSAMDRQRRSL